MPVSSAATKALRQSQVRASRNRHLTALYREALKKFERAIIAKDVASATPALSELHGRLDMLTKNNILHLNNVARKKSKSAQTLKALALSK